MIKEKENKRLLTIDLDGPKGNAFALIGLANNLAKQLELNNINDILKEMKNGDYVNLVKTFDKYFGMVVELETNNQELLDELK